MSSVGFLSLGSLEDARQFVSARALEKEDILARVECQAKEISAPMQNFAVAEMKKHLLRFAPGWLEEMGNMDAALELPENTILQLQSYGHLVQEEKLDCTSWIVAPELTSAGKMLFHKNRDSQFPASDAMLLNIVDCRRYSLLHGHSVKEARITHDSLLSIKT